MGICSSKDKPEVVEPAEEVKLVKSPQPTGSEKLSSAPEVSQEPVAVDPAPLPPPAATKQSAHAEVADEAAVN